MNLNPLGTVARGLRTPVVCPGDDLVSIVTEAVRSAASAEGFILRGRDVVGVTECVLATAQNNYATVDQIAADVRAKFPGGDVALVYPYLSRNRMSAIVKGVARGAKRLTVLLAYPFDELGKALMDPAALGRGGLEGWDQVFEESEFTARFGQPVNPRSGINYLTYFKSLIENEGCEARFLLGNDCAAVLRHTPHALCCCAHKNDLVTRRLRAQGAQTVLCLSDLLTAPVQGSGYNPQYGLLGCNLAGLERVKLFPRDCGAFALAVQQSVQKAVGTAPHVLVYGDGSYKDPDSGVWECFDPVICPGSTPGLAGTSQELKLKYLAADRFSSLCGEELQAALMQYLRKAQDSRELDAARISTPNHRLVNLLGSLCDLVSGSGDKGTPVVLIQGYFDRYCD